MTDVRQTTDILSNGWQTNSTNLNRGYEAECDDDDTWYGFSSGSTYGAINATFQGDGTANLKYGNCHNAGNVKVLLNDNIISEASAGIKDITFSYSSGDELSIVECESTIWKLYSLDLDCR